ncbi:MAG: MBL fold metallo-hydrolase [Rhizobiaceae bacterium]|nr:MBL fold metallo-hydrolase [Rhizobiaceae bacterium]
MQTGFDASHGAPVPAHETLPILRVTANNPGPFTFHGTNSYVLGDERLTIIDPGPADDAHLDALLKAIAGRSVDAILVTHTHADHSPLARALQQATGAPVLGCGPHAPFRDLADGEVNLLDASGDRAHAPDTVLGDGAMIPTELGPLSVVATPGHTANHLCFALDAHGVLFSGDHVMGWSTTIVAPPDGAMAPYMASLDRLIARGDTLYLPGHGGAVDDPQRFTRGLRSHRRMRANAILERLKAGDETVPAIVQAIYAGVDARLHGAAALSVFAHLEELVACGDAATDGPPLLRGRYRMTG